MDTYKGCQEHVRKSNVLRQVHNTTQDPMLHCVVLMFELTATKHKDRLGSYPCVPLQCVLVSDHKKKSLIYEYLCVMQTQRNATYVPLRQIVNQPLL